MKIQEVSLIWKSYVVSHLKAIQNVCKPQVRMKKKCVLCLNSEDQ